VDYYRGNPEALPAEQKGKLEAAAARLKEVNRLSGLTIFNGGIYHFHKVELSEND